MTDADAIGAGRLAQMATLGYLTRRRNACGPRIWSSRVDSSDAIARHIGPSSSGQLNSRRVSILHTLFYTSEPLVTPTNWHIGKPQSAEWVAFGMLELTVYLTRYAEFEATANAATATSPEPGPAPNTARSARPAPRA
jgi:hypothetical protein